MGAADPSPASPLPHGSAGEAETAVPPRPAAPPGGDAEAGDGTEAGGGAAARRPLTEQDLLIAQVQDLDRRIARMDVLISLLEADIERNDLAFGTLASQRLRITLASPGQAPDDATEQPAPSGREEKRR